MLRVLILSAVTAAFRSNYVTVAAMSGAKSVDFEVFGRVQGVFFRKYTKEQAQKLGLRGWCKNTPHGTVLGHMQGPSDKMEAMMQWLKTTGSPSSKIEKCEFRNQMDIEKFTFTDFDIRRDEM
ncbi:acylphosphatase-1 isoform X1 [Helicoverpa armigera]|uniref:acylphosphatase-1 isoform X1 n=2 Tax=Helicoverpa armigera TaxID=29058 RepID=UPI0021122F51|nr:acylphosphatase-1 isoform X2 [Helicoverpa armigera]